MEAPLLNITANQPDWISSPRHPVSDRGQQELQEAHKWDMKAKVLFCCC